MAMCSGRASRMWEGETLGNDVHERGAAAQLRLYLVLECHRPPRPPDRVRRAPPWPATKPDGVAQNCCLRRTTDNILPTLPVALAYFTHCVIRMVGISRHDPTHFWYSEWCADVSIGWWCSASAAGEACLLTFRPWLPMGVPELEILCTSCQVELLSQFSAGVRMLRISRQGWKLVGIWRSCT